MDSDGQATGWAENRMFLEYLSPPQLLVDQNEELEGLAAKQEAWLDHILLLEDDLQWLLCLPHHRFWSQVVYDETLHNCLNSFLTKAPRFFDPVNIYLTEEMEKHLQELFHFIFLIYVRMGTFKESKDSHITPTKFGELIYEYFLFDIPKLLDLCVLYHPSNTALLQKLVENVFKYQPKYLEDLATMTDTILEGFDNVRTRLGMAEKGPGIEAIENANRDSLVSSLQWDVLSDTIYYLVDISATLSAFLEVYSPAAEIFYANDVLIRITSFYELVIPALQTTLRRWVSNPEMKEHAYGIAKVLTLSKNCMIRIVRSIIFQHCLQPVTKSDHQQMENLQKHVEEYVELLGGLPLEGSFIQDYQQKFPLENDAEFFHQHNVEVDANQFQYILDTIYSLMGKTSNGLLSLKLEKSTSSSKPLQSDAPTLDHVDYNSLYGEGAVASPAATDIEMTQFLSQVQDLLPELGEGFIQECLEYYNYNVEKVIHAVLEDELPKSLSVLDKTMKSRSRNPVNRQTAVPNDVGETESEPSILPLMERKNVFDNDEFDVFNRTDVDRSRIFKGKRGLRGKQKEILNDKSHIHATKELYEKYNIVVEEIFEGDSLYDDEYDDTYDENMVGTMEPDQLESDNLEGRPCVTPRVLMRNEKRTCRIENDDEDHNDSQENEEKEKPRDCFIPNPEDLRKKREQKWQQQQQSRTSRNSNHQPKSDLKGKPKGQGQDDNVLKNRNFKEKHKSSRANHNRKNAADWKRSRGMFPA